MEYKGTTVFLGLSRALVQRAVAYAVDWFRLALAIEPWPARHVVLGDQDTLAAALAGAEVALREGKRNPLQAWVVRLHESLGACP